MKNNCRGCGFGEVVEVFNAGPQPLSNSFLNAPEESCDMHPTCFGYCTRCGLAQLLRPRACESMRSRHAWLSYNEPEGHLDHLVGVLLKSSIAGRRLRVSGVTYKDDSTLERFCRRGFVDSHRLDQDKDLKIHEPLASLETIQARLTPELAKEIAAHYGLSDVLVVRHLLEHAQNPLALVRACQELTNPAGWMVFEVPDSRKMLLGGDHCLLWEEHITYFTAATIERFFSEAGFTDVEVLVYPYAMEDSLVAVVRNLNAPRAVPVAPVSGTEEIQRIIAFGGSFGVRGERIRAYLKALSMRGKKTALFGAGHHSLKFINYYNLAPYLCFVVDDNPHKQGLFLPGSGLPIVGSEWLQSHEVDLCLLGLNPESEQKVLQARKDYVQRGGRFLSIFSASAKSIDEELKND